MTNISHGISRQIDSLESHCVFLHQQHGEDFTRVCDLTTEGERQKGHIAALEKQLETLKNEKTALADDKSELQGEKKKLLDEKQGAKQERDDAIKNLEEQAKAHAEASTKQDEELANLQTKLQQERSRVLEFSPEQRSTLGEAPNAITKIRDLEKTLTSRNNHIKDLKGEHEDQLKVSRHEKVDVETSLREELEKRQIAESDVTMWSNKYKEDQQGHIADLTAKDETIDVLQQGKGKLEDGLATVRRDLESAQASSNRETIAREAAEKDRDEFSRQYYSTLEKTENGEARASALKEILARVRQACDEGDQRLADVSEKPNTKRKASSAPASAPNGPAAKKQ